MSDSRQMDYDYYRGFDHGVNFVINELRRLAATGDITVEKLMLSIDPASIYKEPEQDLDAPLTLNGVDLYPKREWQGLTDEEIAEMHNEIKVRLMGTYRTEDIYRAIEAKLKEKNT